MIKVIIDRFGSEVKTAVYEKGGFIVDEKVFVGPTFFGWLFGFDGKISIVDQPQIVDEYVSAVGCGWLLR